MSLIHVALKHPDKSGVGLWRQWQFQQQKAESFSVTLVQYDSACLRVPKYTYKGLLSQAIREVPASQAMLGTMLLPWTLWVTGYFAWG